MNILFFLNLRRFKTFDTFLVFTTSNNIIIVKLWVCGQLDKVIHKSTALYVRF